MIHDVSCIGPFPFETSLTDGCYFALQHHAKSILSDPLLPSDSTLMDNHTSLPGKVNQQIQRAGPTICVEISAQE